MFTDSIGRQRFHTTCQRCGNMGPPERVWSKRKGRYVLVCMWCLDKLRKRIRRKRLDAETVE